MSDQPKRPLMILLTSHWITMLGVALVTLAGCFWVFLLPLHLRGHIDNPYIGLLVFIAIPILFFLGLALVPVGIALTRRHWAGHLESVPDKKQGWRRAGTFFAAMTFANILIGSQLTYKAVEHMETVQFCGQSCHVMKPEFTAHLMEPHRQVACVTCHVVPGAAGWVKSKIAGTRQLAAVVFNTHPRPIESAMENNRLVSSSETCEQCHSRETMAGERLRVLTKFKDDEASTRNETVLMMLLGGGRLGGIHGSHLGPGVSIRYAVEDKKRQTIPWIEYRNRQSGVSRTYQASDAKPELISQMSVFEMQCVDCHNRAAHSFETPDHAVDDALASGQVSSSLPFVKKTAVELIKAEYASSSEAARQIPRQFAAFYEKQYPGISGERRSDIETAGRKLAGIYERNVFPDLKVTWGTYPNNLGHTDYPGCFRCHDDAHMAADKKTITQDCNTCHRALAVEETSPEVLKTLGTSDRSMRIQEQ